MLTVVQELEEVVEQELVWLVGVGEDEIGEKMALAT